MTAATAPDRVLDALADRTRRRVLRVLADHGQATATTLAAELPVSRQAIVQHLHALGDAGLVDRHRRGREMLFHVEPGPLASTGRWLSQQAARWDARLLAIKRLAESDEE